MKKKVVITGIGAMTACGEGAEALWQAVTNQRSAIDFISWNGGHGWKPMAAKMMDFNPEKYVTQKKALKVMARDIQLAVAAASLAANDSGMTGRVRTPEREGVIVGAGVLNHELEELSYSIQGSLDENGELDLKKFGEEGISLLFPLWLLKYLPNMPACHISIFFNLQGFNNTLTTGSSAGLQAVGEAARIIERGDADWMLAGGTESKVNPVGLSQYQVMGVLSDVYRPFDSASKGFVVGEGAGFLVLEEKEHAEKRKAKIYAELVGFGSSSGVGQPVAMNRALEEAGIGADQINYVQASGLGLPKDDDSELRALEKVFHNNVQNRVHLGVSKPVIGFTGFAAGALDLIISTLVLKNQMVPPLMNVALPNLPSIFQIPQNQVQQEKMEYAMTNAFGFHGQSVSLVTKAYRGVSS